MERKWKIFQFIHRISVGIAFVSILIPIVFWKWIPDTIPMHYNAAGQVDNWSDKTSLILLLFVILILLGLMCITEYYLRVSAISKNADDSEQNQMFMVHSMIVLMNLLIQLMFLYMIVCIVSCRRLGRLFLPVSLVVVFLPLVWYLVKYYRSDSVLKSEKQRYRQREKMKTEKGVVYRSKVDWWLAVLLIFPFLLEAKHIVSQILLKQIERSDWILFGVSAFLFLLIAPLFFIRYTMYSDYLLIDCHMFGKERIRYQDITKIQKTLNPLSSAAMSLKRIQIEYFVNGTQKMTLISPVNREKFIAELEKRRG